MRIILILLLLTSVAFAGELRTPPPVKESGLQDYLFNIRDNWNNLPVVTTNPDGSRPGKKGDEVLYQNNSIFYRMTCVSASGDAWQGTKLINID